MQIERPARMSRGLDRYASHRVVWPYTADIKLRAAWAWLAYMGQGDVLVRVSDLVGAVVLEGGPVVVLEQPHLGQKVLEAYPADDHIVLERHQ